MKTFKADLKSESYWAIGFVIFLSVFALLSTRFSMKNWPLLICFDVIYLAFCFLSKSLSEIQIDEERKKLTVIKSNLLNIKRYKYYDFTRLQYTYKRKAIGAGRVAIIVNVCTLYNADKIVADLIPTKDGWDDDEILNLVYQLIDMGVPKKFVGYGLKDVELKNSL
jgi:hypothetical protein